MLEYEFTKLDDDFITLWAKYIINQDESLIIDDLQKLARLGQINAVQSWYLFKEKGDDRVIDHIVQGYTGGSYNEIFAIGNYNRTDNTKRNTHDEMMAHLKYLADCYSDNKGSWNDVEEYAHEILKKDPCIQPFYEAMKHAIEQGKSLNDFIIMERANEMVLTYARYAPLTMWQNDLCKNVLTNCKKIRKGLLKQYKQRIKNNPNFSAKDDPMFCYALAKSIFFLAEDIYTSDSDKQLAINLLRELANREYTQINSKHSFTGRAKMQSIFDVKKPSAPKTIAEQEIDELFNRAQNSTDSGREQ